MKTLLLPVSEFRRIFVLAPTGAIGDTNAFPYLVPSACCPLSVRGTNSEAPSARSYAVGPAGLRLPQVSLSLSPAGCHNA